MKIAIIYFTFSKDANLLTLALEGIKRLKKKYQDITIDVYVYDDANSPLSTIPEDVIYEQTIFERKNNLNDYKCVYGMLERYKRAVDNGCDWVIKCDSDTVINSLEWVLVNDPNDVSQTGKNNGSYFQGPCYALSKIAVNELFDNITERKTKIYAQMCYLEDKTFSKLVDKVCSGKKVNVPKENSLGYCFSDSSDYSYFLKYYAVDFKPCLWHTKSDQWQSNRECAEHRMKQFLENTEKPSSI